PYYPGNPVTVKGNTGQLMQDKYNFIGWNTDEGYGGTHYRTYGTFNMGTHDVTLYAEWDENPMVVTLTPDWKGSKTTNSYTGPGFLPSDVDKASITTVQNTGTADISNISFT